MIGGFLGIVVGFDQLLVGIFTPYLYSSAVVENSKLLDLEKTPLRSRLQLKMTQNLQTKINDRDLLEIIK